MWFKRSWLSSRVHLTYWVPSLAHQRDQLMVQLMTLWVEQALGKKKRRIRKDAGSQRYRGGWRI